MLHDIGYLHDFHGPCPCGSTDHRNDNMELTPASLMEKEEYPTDRGEILQMFDDLFKETGLQGLPRGIQAANLGYAIQLQYDHDCLHNWKEVMRRLKAFHSNRLYHNELC